MTLRIVIVLTDPKTRGEEVENTYHIPVRAIRAMTHHTPEGADIIQKYRKEKREVFPHSCYIDSDWTMGGY